MVNINIHRISSRIMNMLTSSMNKEIKIKFSLEDKVFSILAPSEECWRCIKDVLLIREYEYLPEFELKNFKDKIIIDAGANIGLYTLIASAFAETVISIEANPLNYQYLQTNITNNNITNIISINKALMGRKKEYVNIHFGSFSGESSIFEISKDSIRVPVITLEEIIEEFGIIDLLKIDIEGAEFDVFENTDLNTLKKINYIVGEIHTKRGNINSIINKLENAGFKVMLFQPPLLRTNKYGYTIKVYDLLRLKFLTKLVYQIVPMLNFKNKDLLMLFAIRRW
ncbi:FkbM family methyltransferase [Methanocaldococcus sp.]